MRTEREQVRDILDERQRVDAKVRRLDHDYEGGSAEEVLGPVWYTQPFSELLEDKNAKDFARGLGVIRREFEGLRSRLAGEIMELGALYADAAWVSDEPKAKRLRDKHYERALVIERVARRADERFEKKAGVKPGWLGR